MDGLVDSFIDLTQWAGSRQEAQAYVEAGNGDLNAALSLYFDAGAGAGRPQPPPPRPAEPQVPTQSLMEELSAEYKRDLVKTAAPRVAPGLAVLNFVFPRPLSLLVALLDSFVGFLGNFVPKIPLSADKSAQFGALLDSVLPSSGEPRVLRGITYNAALEHVKSRFGYLVVVITSEIHETQTPEFITQVLQTNTSRRENVYLWFGTALTTEGLGIAEAYGAPSLPLVALVSPSPKSAQSNVIVMAKLCQLCGGASLDTPSKRDEFDALSGRAIDDHEPKLLSLRLDRERFDADRKIRQEQDAAYEQSLKKDQKRAEEAEAQKRQQHLEEKQHLVWLRGVFERAANAESTEAGTKCARVSLRLPDGHRHILNVPAGSPVRVVYDLAYALLNPGEQEKVAKIDIVEEPDYGGYEPAYGFSLVSTVLRRTLPADETDVQNVEAIWPSGVLMVDLD